MWRSILDTPLAGFIPSPDQVFSSLDSIRLSAIGSMGMAAAAGGLYGLAGRVLYPNSNLSSVNYAVCFLVAYQIKQCWKRLERQGGQFVCPISRLEGLEPLIDGGSGWSQMRLCCWKILQLKDKALIRTDQIVSRIFGMRLSHQVTADNVKDASFLEMCRFRIWSVFKETLLNHASFSLAYRLSNAAGFTLPNRSAVPLLLLVQNIAQNIIFIPALYRYLHFCNRLAEELDENPATTALERAEWIKRFLPSL